MTTIEYDILLNTVDGMEWAIFLGLAGFIGFIEWLNSLLNSGILSIGKWVMIGIFICHCVAIIFAASLGIINS